MAGTMSEEFGVGRSKEGISSGQYCQSGEALAEWWSSYWGTDDDNDLGVQDGNNQITRTPRMETNLIIQNKRS